MGGQIDSHSKDVSARIAALEKEVARLRAEVDGLRKAGSVPFGALVAHPLFVLAASLGAVLAFAALVILDRELAKGPDQHTFFLIYMVPIAAPFAAFLLDRAQRWLFTGRMPRQAYLPLAVDVPVVMLGFARALYSVPFISGHALFLAYALLTTRSRTAQVLSVLVLAEVIYFKVFVWHDPTLYGGILVATAAALIFHLLNRGSLAVNRSA